MKPVNVFVALAFVACLSAVRAPGGAGGDVAALIEQMASYQEAVSQAAEKQLAKLPVASVLGRLRTALKHDDWPARAGAIRLLAGLSDKSSAGRIAALLDDPVWRVRQEAAVALGKLKARAAVGALRAAAADPDPVVRVAVVTALGRIGDTAALKALLAALEDKSQHVRTAALTAVNNTSTLGLDDIYRVLSLLDHTNGTVRRAASSLLQRAATHAGKLPPALADALIPLLGRAEPGHRQLAANLLGWCGNPKAVAPLKILLDDPNKAVRKAALAALNRLKVALPYEAYLALLSDPDPEIAAEAVRGLARVRIDKRAVGPLLRQLDSGNWSTRSSAAAQLGRIKDPAVLEGMLRRLKAERQKYVTRAMVKVIADYDGPRVADTLIGLLDSKRTDYVVRWAAISGLARTRSPLAYRALVKTLKTDPTCRSNAAYALMNFPGNGMVAPMIDALRANGAKGYNGDLIRVLGYMGDPAAVGPLNEVLRDGSLEVRWIAVEALGRIGGDEAVRRIIELTRSEESKIRHSAVYACQLARDRRALDAVRAGLHDETHVIVLASVLAIERMPDRRSVGPLIDVIRKRCAASAEVEEKIASFFAHVRGVTARALGAIGDPRAAPVLIDTLTDADKPARLAADALGKLGDARAVGPLIQALAHTNQDVRDAAAAALIRLRARGARAAVLDALRDTTSWQKRWQITEGFAALADASMVGGLLAALQAGAGATATAPADAPKLRQAMVAAAALGRMQARRAAEPLAALLAGQGDLARTAAMALGEIAGSRAAAALRGAVTSRDEHLAAAAAEALGRTGDPHALEVLLGILKSSSPDRPVLRRGAARGLGHLKDKQSIQPLIDTALRDADVEVRRWAIKAMYEMPDDRIVGAMAKVLRGPDRNSRLYAERALSRLGTKAVVGPLTAAARTWDYTIRTEAIDTLRKITGRKHPLWPARTPSSRPAR